MILLDTHVLLWYLADHPSLPATIKKRIEDTPQVFVSAASIWEIAIKGSIKGKTLCLGGQPLNSPEAVGRLASECASQGLRLLEITAEACTIAPFFPGTHKDPFDRIIAAQSLVPERLTLLSADAAFDSFGNDVVRYWPEATSVTIKKKPRKSSL